MTDKPDHMRYGRAMSGAPVTYAGVTLYVYRVGILQYVLATPDGRVEVRGHGARYVATVDGERVGTFFKNRQRAAEKAIEALLLW